VQWVLWKLVKTRSEVKNLHKGWTQNERP
jgi:hypothetical protein